eukprot:PhF_6_TR537/c0_g2_i2/m.411
MQHISVAPVASIDEIYCSSPTNNNNNSHDNILATPPAIIEHENSNEQSKRYLVTASFFVDSKDTTSEALQAKLRSILHTSFDITPEPSSSSLSSSSSTFQAVVTDVSPSVLRHQTVLYPSPETRSPSLTPLLNNTHVQLLLSNSYIVVLCFAIFFLGCALWFGCFIFPSQASVLVPIASACVTGGLTLQALRYHRGVLLMIFRSVDFWFQSIALAVYVSGAALLMWRAYDVPLATAMLSFASFWPAVSIIGFGLDASPYGRVMRSLVIAGSGSVYIGMILLMQTYILENILPPRTVSVCKEPLDLGFMITTIQSMIVSSCWSMFIFMARHVLKVFLQSKRFVILVTHWKEVEFR